MENLVVIDPSSNTAAADLQSLASYLEGKEYISYDTETTGLDKDAEVIGYSVAADPDTGYYVILAHWDTETKTLVHPDKEYRETAISILAVLTSKKLIMHNAVFDVEKTWENFGIDLMPALHTDTMIMAHLVNENERVGLKDLGTRLFGESAKKEQEDMKISIVANGGLCDAKNFELYKADKHLIGLYAAKDAVLTIKLFYHLAPIIIEEGLDNFFWDDECMPLLKGPTYQLNTVGLKVDIERLRKLEKDLTDETIRLKAEILDEIKHYILEDYPGKTPKTSFNIDSPSQLSWLLFIRLGEEFRKLTKGGRKVAKDLVERLPYTSAQKRRFIEACKDRGIKPQRYMQCDKATLSKLSDKHDWVRKLLEYKKAEKMLGTYATGIQQKIKYGVIRPSFLQTGTTGTRYSSRAPNFQNLPRDDKRIKSCIVSRPGKVFVGADYSQLEPRVFTSMSEDPILTEAYAKGEDFYSALAIPIFGRYECSAMKDADNYLGKKYPELRQVGKECALSLAYGTTPYKLSETLMAKAKLDMSLEQCTEILNDYFNKLQGVSKFVKDSHNQAVTSGKVYNLFGRPRRIPEALILKNMLKSVGTAAELPYQYRTFLNLAVNFRVQGTAGSIVNRACIAFEKRTRENAINCKIVLQVHDEIVVECSEADSHAVSEILKDCMENTVVLPGVRLIADPKIAKNLGDLK